MQKNTFTLAFGGAQLSVELAETCLIRLEQALPDKDDFTGDSSAFRPPYGPSRPEEREGERYVGAITGADGHGHRIFRMPYEPGKKVDWKEALQYASDNGGELPDRVESALLHATQVEGEFDKADWYWTREQHAGGAAYAWCQGFANGNQYLSHKDYELRVVLVRRVAI